MTGKLILSDGTTFEGTSFGAPHSHSGEIVFATGMTGYPQAFTDPSFAGQILIMTYPLIGNYGVPQKKLWESDKLQINGLIVSDYIDTPSHFQSKQTLASWLKKEKIPALVIKDTRALTQHLRSKGVMLGKIIIDKDIPQYDPNQTNLVAQVSTKKIKIEEPVIARSSATQNDAAIPSKRLLRYARNDIKNKIKTIVIIDCGAKRNITKCFLKRGVKTITVPWDYDPFEMKLNFNALFVSNGPGDPKMADKTIQIIKKALAKKMPILGICLGNQLLALAAGGDTYKLKYGHRSQNQPCKLVGSERCYITTQNHGFAIKKVPDGFEPWFVNANDQTVEGIKHKKYPFMSVQFHPEATPGPMDTEWIFDYFLERIKK
jgi:carbamoyl-phosphate synthase small subunit